mmetsp:Transcript_12449/g.21265  ORF Transcript_12449/g.21265 Transcript_12449/m.21265 type:complete len:461 (-) Transcript_12449:60-1442(-)
MSSGTVTTPTTMAFLYTPTPELSTFFPKKEVSASCSNQRHTRTVIVAAAGGSKKDKARKSGDAKDKAAAAPAAKGFGKESASTASAPASASSSTSSAVKGDKPTKKSKKNGSGSDSEYSDEELVTRASKEREFDEEVDKNTLFIEPERMEHPLDKALREAEGKRRRFPLEMMSLEEMKSLQFPINSGIKEVASRLYEAYAKGEDYFKKVVVSNRSFVRHKLMVYLASLKMKYEREQNEVEAKKCGELMFLLVGVHMEYDVAFKTCVLRAEEALKEAITANDVKGKIKQWTRGKDALHINALWTVIYAALSAWNAKKIREGPQVVKNDLVTSIKSAADCMDEIPDVAKIIAPELRVIQNVLRAKSEDKDQYIKNVPEDQIRSLGILIGQSELYPVKSYGPFVTTCVKIYNAIMKLNYNMEEGIVFEPIPESELKKDPGIDFKLTKFSRNMSPDEGMKILKF